MLSSLGNKSTYVSTKIDYTEKQDNFEDIKNNLTDTSERWNNQSLL